MTRKNFTFHYFESFCRIESLKIAYATIKKCSILTVIYLKQVTIDSFITRDDSQNPAIGRLITSVSLERTSGREYHMSAYLYVL